MRSGKVVDMSVSEVFER